MAGTWTQSNGYDAVGNRWVSGYPGMPSPTSETPQTTNWFTAANRMSGWSYDSMGNVTSVTGTNRVFTYDGENRQTSATIAGVGATFGYDSDGKRVTKAVQGGATTVFVYDADGQLAQEISTAAPTNASISYLTADHLGSTRLVTDSVGGVKRRLDYLPFGEELLSGPAGGLRRWGTTTGRRCSRRIRRR